MVLVGSLEVLPLGGLVVVRVEPVPAGEVLVVDEAVVEDVVVEGDEPGPVSEDVSVVADSSPAAVVVVLACDTMALTPEGDCVDVTSTSRADKLYLARRTMAGFTSASAPSPSTCAAPLVSSAFRPSEPDSRCCHAR
jgi:hypothetical protein